MQWEISGTRGDKSGRWKVEASDEATATQKATASGIQVGSVKQIGALLTNMPNTTAVAVVASIEPAVVCGNCGRAIGRLEMPWDYQGHTVCAQCAQSLTPQEPVEQAAPPPNYAPAPNYAPVSYATANVMVSVPQTKGISGLGLAAIIMGSIALVGSWVPLLGLLAIPLAAIGLLLAIIGFIISLAGRRSGVGMPITGGAICMVAMAIPVLMTAGLVAVGGSSLSRAAEQANRVKCASNLRQIGQAVAMFSNNSSGHAFPDSLDQIPRDELDPSALTCPDGGGYTYVGKGMTAAISPEAIVAYESPTAHHGEGENFLYGDFHVEWQPATEAKRIADQVSRGINPPK